MSVLESGPYSAPKCRIGGTLRDEMLGDVKVTGKQDGPIPWPLCDEPPRKGPNRLGQIPVLTGDLVKAVCEESISAVSEHWDVPRSLVRKWRAAIAGPGRNRRARALQSLITL